MNTEALGRTQLQALLGEVGDDLAARGIRGEMFLVGGAALAIAYNTRRFTRDVDAVFEPKTEVYAAARRVAARHGLPPDWLNDAVKGMLPGMDPNAREVMSAPGLRVSVPSPRYLLALKVYAARVDRDTDDIRFLAQRCNANTADDVLNITEEVMGSRPLPPKSQYIVEELFPPAKRRWYHRLKKPKQPKDPAPPTNPAPSRANTTASTSGICGARTTRGGYCKNPAASCPHHP